MSWNRVVEEIESGSAGNFVSSLGTVSVVRAPLD